MKKKRQKKSTARTSAVRKNTVPVHMTLEERRAEKKPKSQRSLVLVRCDPPDQRPPAERLPIKPIREIAKLQKKSSRRIQSRADYDPDFVPAYGPARRARRKMLAKYFVIRGGKIHQLDVDGFEAELFRRQERDGEKHLSALRSVMGPKANWRDELVLQAGRHHTDLSELKWRLAHAALVGDIRELTEFNRAARRVARLKARAASEKNKPLELARLVATFYGWQHEARHGKLPTRKATVVYLERVGVPLPKSGRDPYNSNASRIFRGPYLSRFPRAKSWGGESPITSRK